MELLSVSFFPFSVTAAFSWIPAYIWEVFLVKQGFIGFCHGPDGLLAWPGVFYHMVKAALVLLFTSIIVTRPDIHYILG